MGRETERKFLVKNDDFKRLAQGVSYRQGYLNSAKERTVRLREAGGKGFLTVKGPSLGPSRDEYEYEIPLDECRAMLGTLAEKPLIEKLRYSIPQGKHCWEVDEFLGANQGLVVAEIELDSPDETFHKPAWLGDEVTGDPKYFNSNLVKHPYSKW